MPDHYLLYELSISSAAGLHFAAQPDATSGDAERELVRRAGDRPLRGAAGLQRVRAIGGREAAGVSGRERDGEGAGSGADRTHHGAEPSRGPGLAEGGP